MITMSTVVTTTPDYTRDVNQEILTQCEDGRAVINNESLLNLTTRVRNLMNASLDTEEVNNNPPTEEPQNAEEE